MSSGRLHRIPSHGGAQAGVGNVLTPQAGSMKYIIVVGGTVSGLGKGTAISSLGVVLKSHGYKVTCIKIDPYLNVDAGTMSPFEHGEVFVLEDGGEADLDLGNYERFLDVTLSSKHNMTSGKVYKQVIERERRGDYLGKTVQMVPHVTDVIQDWISEVGLQPVDGRSIEHPQICLVELGGTVGDIESAVYLEAIQQFICVVGEDNACIGLVALVPVMGVVGEQKTKTVQHSTKLLRASGLRPDFIFCRLEQPLEESTKKKISVHCQVPTTHVISMHDVSNIYHVPLVMEDQDVGANVLQRLGLEPHTKSLSSSPSASASDTEAAKPPKPVLSPGNIKDWRKMAERVDSCHEVVRIGLVGKYTGLQDSYLSVIKALKHACIEAGFALEIEWIESALLEHSIKDTEIDKHEAAWKQVAACDGILVPGGFGDRGVEGKTLAAKYCRDHNVPYLGICLGLQTAVISFARDVIGLEDANSSEFDDRTAHDVVVFMPEINPNSMGGTMRLGSRVTIIRDTESLAYKLYGHPVVYERHRHRYEVNPKYVNFLENHGLKFSGHDERGQRMEILEIPTHKYFVATQFHPEYKSRPMYPSPVFLGLILASKNVLEARLEKDGGILKVGSGWKHGMVL